MAGLTGLTGPTGLTGLTGLTHYGLGDGELALLAGKAVRTIYIIGDTDTGKSTLALLIAKRLAKRFRTAMVDLDAGQASIGLPTTFAWAMCGARGPGRTRGMFFTGTTSPAGYFEESIAGASAMVGEAREAAKKVVIDTCGLATGDAGRALHHATIEAARPDAVVGIERADELGDVIGPLEKAGWPRVVRARAPEAARRRSAATRRSYRAEKFREYFVGARQLVLGLDEVGVLRAKDDPEGRIASLRDAKGRDVALGIVDEFDAGKGTMTVLTPLKDANVIRAVVLGAMRIARDGRQLARNV